MSVFHDEVEIEDFEFDEDTETYYYPCPCGDLFQISKVDMHVCLVSHTLIPSLVGRSGEWRGDSRVSQLLSNCKSHL